MAILTRPKQRDQELKNLINEPGYRSSSRY